MCKLKNKKLVIIGATEFAEIACDYFTKDTEYEVVAFSVDPEFLVQREIKGLPVVSFDTITEEYPSSDCDLFTAITYGKMNGVRKGLFEKGKKKGYKFASYISPHSFVWDNVSIGEDVFIFEDNTIQYNAKIGTGCVLWSGNHIGHSAIIGDFCFVSSHVVVSGYTNIGDMSFCGVNSTFGNNLNIASQTLVGAGSVITKNIEETGKVYVGNPASKLNKKSVECL